MVVSWGDAQRCCDKGGVAQAETASQRDNLAWVLEAIIDHPHLLDGIVEADEGDGDDSDGNDEDSQYEDDNGDVDDDGDDDQSGEHDDGDNSRGSDGSHR